MPLSRAATRIDPRRIALGTKTDALGNLIISDGPSPRPAVLLFHPDPGERRRWTRALEGRCNVRGAGDLTELERELDGSTVDVVVADWSDGLVDRLQRKKDVRLIHCSPAMPESMLQAAERGVQFAHVDGVHELAEKIFSVTFPRSVMARHVVKNLLVRWRDSAEAYRLLDISNDGFSFRVEADQPLDAMLPGTVLDELEMNGPDGEALSGGSAIVRHVEVSESGGAHYWVGCEMRHPPPAAPSGQMTIIQDRALGAGLLRSALRGGGMVLQQADFQWDMHLTGGELDVDAGRISFSTGGGGFAEHDVLRGRFELGGCVYRFYTSVVQHTPLVVKLPLKLEMAQQRGSSRYQPLTSAPITVELFSPLLITSSLRTVRDLSSTGFSLDLDPLTDLLPPGTYFNRIVVRLPGHEFVCRGHVRNLSRVAGNEEETRCGVEFEGMDEETRVRLAERIMCSRYPGLEDGRLVSFADLWQFLVDTRFIYKEKQATLEPMLPAIQRTMDALNSRANPLFKSVVARTGGALVGHVSGLRVYRRTWMSQHLAASNGRHAGVLLNLGQAEYFGQTTDLEYFKIFFRPENKWPARIFGGFARTVTDPRLSDLRTFAYFTIPLDFAVPAPTDIAVIEASEADLSIVERYFVSTERGLLLRSDDLTRRALPLGELNAGYRKLGLQRRRRVLLALHGNTPVGFALAEISSPGLNLSELLSSFRTYVLPDGAERSSQVRAALIAALLPIYRQAERPAAIALTSLAEKPEYEALGLRTSKFYTAWTCHRALYQRFCDHVDRIIRAIGKRAEAPQIHISE